jgi:hypothetical protein
MDGEADALAQIRKTYTANVRRAAAYLDTRLCDARRALDKGETPVQARWVNAALDLESGIQVLGIVDEIEYRRPKPDGEKNP